MTARSIAASVLLPASLLALPAAAEAPSSGEQAVSIDGGNGLAVGVRAAYGMALGETSKGLELRDSFSGAIAPQVEAGYFFNRHVYVGAYFQYGLPLFANDVCLSGVGCRGSALRFGLDVNYHAMPTGSVNPWGGVGAGYEITSLTAEVAGRKSTSRAKGFELAHLQGGFDFQVARALWVGPYLTAAVGQYSKASLTVDGTTLTGDIGDEKSLHFWLQPGLRLQVRL